MQPTLQQRENMLRKMQDKTYRLKLSQSLLGFGLTYMSHHLYLPPGDHHKEMVDAFGDVSIEMLEVIGFRGCTKSTWGSLILPIWAALVKPELYPFIIIILDTMSQSSSAISNIKAELENNRLIREDFGIPKFREVGDDSPERVSLESEEEWQARNLLLSNDVRILSRSRGQKLRGLKHRQFRPRLVIVDDPEDSVWVKTKENRDKTEKWMNAEVMGCLDAKSRKLVVLGNLLHTDALLPRMEKRGLFDKILKIPLFRKDGSCAWPSMYPTKESLDKKQKEMGPVSWQREMLLIPVPDEGQEIVPEDITYYDAIPPVAQNGVLGVGVDPAISKKSTADYTAMVSARAAYVDDKPRIYIMPDPLILRLDVMETLAHAKSINQIYIGECIFFVEDVAYQKALIQLMENELLSVIPMKSLTDKRARLRVASNFIKNGTVQFPATGCEALLQQLFGFGIEEHDDAVDGLVNVILGLVEHGMAKTEVYLL